MDTLPNAPDGGGESLFDPLRRRVEFADVFASPSVRVEVLAMGSLLRRGVVDLNGIRELSAQRADDLVDGVDLLDRQALREAYALLFVEERLIADRFRQGVGSAVGATTPLHVVDAIGDVVDWVCGVERLARAWAGFMFGGADAAE